MVVLWCVMYCLDFILETKALIALSFKGYMMETDGEKNPVQIQQYFSNILCSHNITVCEACVCVCVWSWQSAIRSLITLSICVFVHTEAEMTIIWRLIDFNIAFEFIWFSFPSWSDLHCVPDTSSSSKRCLRCKVALWSQKKSRNHANSSVIIIVHCKIYYYYCSVFTNRERAWRLWVACDVSLKILSLLWYMQINITVMFVYKLCGLFDHFRASFLLIEF